MERDYTTKFIGLNVHSKTISVAIADEGRTGEVRHYGTIENTTEAIEKIIGSLASTGIAHRFIYEAALVVLLCIGITGLGANFY